MERGKEGRETVHRKMNVDWQKLGKNWLRRKTSHVDKGEKTDFLTLLIKGLPANTNCVKKKSALARDKSQ